MNDENRVKEMLDSIGLTDEQRQRVCECASILAERIRIAFKAAVDALCEIIRAEWGAKESSLLKFWKQYKAMGVEPRAQRRKQERNRERAIEQRHRAEIRRRERKPPYRRIYKPP